MHQSIFPIWDNLILKTGKGSDYQYVRYERKLASNETHERIKKNLYKLLLINGLNRFNFEDAVSTLSIK